MNTKFRVTLACAAALATAALAAGISVARANGATCTAFIAGLQSDKSSVPELCVFNTGTMQLSLTLTFRDAAGAVLPTPAETLEVAPFNTAYVSLTTKLKTAGLSGKPYTGRFTLEISGTAPFAQDYAVVHVTQYYGRPGKAGAKPVKPASAFVIRPLFNAVVN
jgi:hypothetical protein